MELLEYIVSARGLRLDLRHPGRRRDDSDHRDGPAGHRRLPDAAAGLHPGAATWRTASPSPPASTTTPTSRATCRHFQALTTALSATVGIGNIAGVAIAIHFGGPGRALLDVGDGLPGHGDQVLRGDAGAELSATSSFADRTRTLGGFGLRRPHVLHRARPRAEVEAAGDLLRRRADDHLLPHRQRGAGQHGGRHRSATSSASRPGSPA